MTNSLPLSVVAVTEDALQETLLEALLDDRSPHDAVFVESVARAYGRIRQLLPERIIVLTRIDDAETCRLLTMLAVDRDLRGIPVVTWAIAEDPPQTDDAVIEERSTGFSGMVRV